MDLLELYGRMALARAFEEALLDLWTRGLISGEMHLGTGEEAVAAGITANIREGDAVALDHRPTPVMVLMGVDMVAMIREMLGEEDGLSRGLGGHMHLMDRKRLVASSGIVGAAGPTAAGFALAAARLRPGSAALSFCGEGAVNEGMMMEAWNLAAAWSLPVLFVVKDNGWAVMTRSEYVTGGDVVERARSFGLAAWDADGLDAMAVWEAAGEALSHVRKGKGPAMMRARCSRLDGHMLGDRMVAPMSEKGEVMGRIMKSATCLGGGGVLSRTASMAHMMKLIGIAMTERRGGRSDPLVVARKRLKAGSGEIDAIDAEARERVKRAVDEALGSHA